MDNKKELPYICPDHPHAMIRREWKRDKWYPRGSGIDYDFHYYCNDCDRELSPPKEEE